MVPSSLSYLGIPGSVLFIVVFALALASFLLPLWTKYRWIRTLGRPQAVDGSPLDRLGNMLGQVFGQTKVLRTGSSPVQGVMHVWMFYGFIVMQLNNLEIFLQGVDPGIHFGFMQGPVLVLIDLVYILVFTSCLAFAFIRYGLRPRRLTIAPESAYVLLFIVGLVVTELGAETLRMSLSGAGAQYGWLAAWLSGAFAHTPAAVRQVWYDVFWWGHLADLAGFMWFLPRSKHMHLLVAPFNLYFEPLGARGRLQPVDLADESAQSFGATKLEDFTWKGLLDLLACIECGRCQDVCPAFQTGKPLSPKEVIVNLKHHLHSKGPVALRVAGGARVEDLGQAASDILKRELPGQVVSEEALWACTTCRACVEACPLGIDPMSKIVDMRRHLVMDVGEMPDGMAAAALSIEERGHPWRGAASERQQWRADLDVRVLGPGEETDVLLWVGCTGALDPRGQKVTRAVARLLKHAGVDFATLGEAEGCTGDPARRMGHEYLFQQRVEANVATLAQRRFRRIVTICPHCLNTLGNEYGDFGGHYTVLHHSQLLTELVAEGRLLPARSDGTPAPAAVTLHDPCYLGRHNGEFDAPRALIGAAGGRLVEMRRSGSRSFCCGAGGGQAFVEDHSSRRINVERAAEALRTGAATVATACPFCMIMMEDGVKTAAGLERRTEGSGTVPDAPPARPVAVRDVAELLAEAVFGEGT